MERESVEMFLSRGAVESTGDLAEEAELTDGEQQSNARVCSV